MLYGLWFMVYGLRFMVYGLRFTKYLCFLFSYKKHHTLAVYKDISFSADIIFKGSQIL